MSFVSERLGSSGGVVSRSSASEVLEPEDLSYHGEQFIDSVENEKCTEDAIEYFKDIFPGYDLLGYGKTRAVFGFDEQLPGEEQSVVKFPIGQRGKNANRSESATWKIVNEKERYDSSWFAELYTASENGTFLVQRKARVFSPVATERAYRYFKDLQYESDEIRINDGALHNENFGVVGGIFGQPVVIDFPWLEKY